jgi:hypothetical protein
MAKQWEYCFITGIATRSAMLFPNYPTLNYISLKGIEMKDLGNKASASRPDEWRTASETDFVAHMIARLGLDGWEMVSVQAECIYFRRPIENGS